MNDQITFRGAEHKQRLLTAVREMGKVYDGGEINPSYGAALYILTADPSMWDYLRKYVDRGIDFETMLKKAHFSTSESVLVRWAANLFYEHAANCNPVELMVLDDGNFELALSALRIRRGELRLSDLV